MNEIRFQFSTYFQGCLILPAIFLLFACIILVSAIVHYGKQVKAQNTNGKNTVSFLVAILIFGFLIGLNGSRIAHGGMYLINEREQDAMTCVGEITQIRAMNRFEFPELSSEGNTTNGVELTVNGMKYTVILKGSFEVGDTVRITYLPRSRYVLSISR